MVFIFPFLFLFLYGCISPTMVKAQGPQQKQKRTVLDVRGTHHVTQRALSHIMQEVKKHGVIEATSRSTVQRERHAFVNRDTPFGKVIQNRKLIAKKGGTIKLPFLHPAAILWVCCSASTQNSEPC